MKQLILIVSLVCVGACNPDKGTTDSEGTAGTTDGSSSTTGTATDGTTSSTSDSTASTEPTTTGTSTTDVSSTTDASSTTAVSVTDASSTTVDEPPAACGCVNGGCGASLCPHVAVTCESYCGDTPEVLSDEAALQCALEALRERTPGKLTWSRSENGGQFGSSRELWILDDGTIATDRESAEDLCYSTGPAELGTLEPPAYFDGCLAELDPLVRFDCMTGAIAETTVECVPEEDNCDI